MKDNFGSVMLENLSQRGIVLPGIPVCETLDSQKRRFLV